MKKTKVFRNKDISRVLIGAPNSHQHLRTITRARTRTVKKTKKEGYTQYQLLESEKSSKQVQNEVTQLIT
jgi:gas vesicle protein